MQGVLGGKKMTYEVKSKLVELLIDESDLISITFKQGRYPDEQGHIVVTYRENLDD